MTLIFPMGAGLDFYHDWRWGFDADGKLIEAAQLTQGLIIRFQMMAVICFSMLLWYKFV